MKAFILINIQSIIFRVIFCISVLFPWHLISQADLTIGGYFQDFGTTAPAWTSGATSGTMQGWYYNETNRGNVNITGTNSPSANGSNSGGIYTYTCSGNAMIGSRASGSASNIYYGVRLKNTSGTTITRIEVSFECFQVSLAQSGSNTNTIEFDYRTAATVTSLTGGTWTAVPALDFSSVVNGPAGSNQVQWYPPCQSTARKETRSSCITVNIPAGNEIMLRWYDVDDPSNDHHMGIDNISVLAFDANGGNCISPLSTDVIDFKGKYENQSSVLNWITISERNNSHYTISRSADGVEWDFVGDVEGAGSSNEKLNYQLTDYNPKKGINYYRLQSTDFDGEVHAKGIVALEVNQYGVHYNHTSSSIELSEAADVEIYSTDGKLVATSVNTSSIPFHHLGMFLIHFTKAGKTERIFIK